MTKGRAMKASEVGGIAYLCKAGHNNKYISNLTGIPLRTVQHWTKKFRDNDFKDIVPLHKKRTGKPHKLSIRTLSVLKREVDKSPRITAR